MQYSWANTPLAEPVFGGPSLLSAMPAFTFSGGDAAPRGFAAANYFNATKTPASGFKYFVSTNNNALVSIEFLNETSGEFNLATKGVVGAGTVTVQAVAVERDVDAWRAATTFAVKVVNDLADPTLIQALPDVTNAGAVNLTQYFADTDGDLTYEVEVSDPAVVTASVVGDILTLANAANASGTATVTVRARDSNAQANDTFTVTFSFVTPPTPYPTISIHNGPWGSFTNLKQVDTPQGRNVFCYQIYDTRNGGSITDYDQSKNTDGYEQCNFYYEYQTKTWRSSMEVNPSVNEYTLDFKNYQTRDWIWITSVNNPDVVVFTDPYAQPS